MIAQVDTVVVRNNTPLKFIDVSDPWNNPITFIALVSILIAIFALFSPIIVNWISEKIRLKKLKIFIKYLIDSIIIDFNQYTRNLDKLKTQLIDSAIKEFDIPSLSEINIHSLAKVDYKDLYMMFVTKQSDKTNESAKHLSFIIKATNWLNSNDILQKNMSNFMSDLRRYDGKISDNVDNILRGFDSYLSKMMAVGDEYKDDEFLVKFRNLIAGLRNSNDPDNIEVIKDELVDKLKELCREYLSHSEASKFLNFTINVNDGYLNMTSIRESYTNNIDETITSLKSDMVKS